MRRGLLWVPVFILLLAAYWRLHDLESQSLWHDEGNSLRLAERNLNDLVDAVSRDIHPPGYYLALKAWTQLVGTTEFGLRSLSALWGVVAVAATCGLGRRLFGVLPGAIAALLIAGNTFAIYYGQEARMYAQLGALSILSLWLLIKFLDKGTVAWAFGLAGVNLLGLYTHYTYPFTMIIQGFFFVWWWVMHHDRLGTYMGLNSLTLLLFLPWLPTAYDQVTTWPSTGDTTSTLDRLERVFSILFYGYGKVDLSLLAYVLPIGLILLGLLNIRRLKAAWRWALPFALIVISVGALLGSGAYREANLKFLLPSQSAAALLVGCGAGAIVSVRFSNARLVVLGQYGVAIVLVGLLVGANIREIATLYEDPALARSDYRRIAQDIEASVQADHAIILNAPNQQEVFSYYYDGKAPLFPLPRGLGGDDPATRAEILDIVAQYQRIYLVLWGQQERDPNAVVERTLGEHAYVVEREWYNDVELVQYAALAPPPDEPTVRVDEHFSDHIVLEGFSLSEDTFEVDVGNVLGVTLYWITNAQLTERYKVSVQLLFPNGTLAEQHDSEPANGQAPTTDWEPGRRVIDNHGLVIHSNFPAGEYTLIVVVYNADDPADRLRPINGDINATFALATIVLN